MLEKIENALNIARKWFLPLSIVLIVVSVTGMYFASLCIESIAVSDMNNFVSIILGIVALTTSIISTVLSFYNLEKSQVLNQQQQDSLKTMTEIQNKILEKLNQVDETTQDIAKGQYRYRGNIPKKAVTKEAAWHSEDEVNE